VLVAKVVELVAIPATTTAAMLATTATMMWWPLLLQSAATVTLSVGIVDKGIGYVPGLLPLPAADAGVADIV
jgi:hypothetical protein